MDRLLGILEINLSGRRTRKDRNILKSTSTFASANTVIELFHLRFDSSLCVYGLKKEEFIFGSFDSELEKLAENYKWKKCI